eukprot:1009247-Amphidinium_carterae.1
MLIWELSGCPHTFFCLDVADLPPCGLKSAKAMAKHSLVNQHSTIGTSAPSTSSEKPATRQAVSDPQSRT